MVAHWDTNANLVEFSVQTVVRLKDEVFSFLHSANNFEYLFSVKQ